MIESVRSILVLVCVGVVTMALAAGAEDAHRIEGVVTALHAQEFVLLTNDRKTVVIDMSALGGITMALATGQTIVAIGTMAPDGGTFHAIRLVTPSAHPELPAKP